jgi:GTP-binding protein YchF
MKIGLVGLPLTGKTTFFNLLTGAAKDSESSSYAKSGALEGTARIPDERIDFLAGIYKPKKVTYATIDVIDINGITPESSGSKGSSAYHFLEKARQVDALVHVVRAFRDDRVPHIDGSIDPLRDIQTINMELLFADLAVIENRIQRIETGKKVTKENLQELEVLKKCRECLESEKLINSMNLSDEEKVYLRTFNFLTERPLVLLVNLDDEQFSNGSYERKEELLQYAAAGKLPVIEVSAKTELEISELDEEDKKLFMEDLGIKETGISRLASTVYDYLQLISFLTVGDDEVKAWTIRKGTQAKAAGGKIHSDIERGFIRAEVVKYSDFKSLGSMQKVKEKGLFRLEGKEAVIEDGDIINFRFNV